MIIIFSEIRQTVRGTSVGILKKRIAVWIRIVSAKFRTYKQWPVLFPIATLRVKLKKR